MQKHWQQYAVHATTLEHCIGVADYAAVLRPKVSEEHIRETIRRPGPDWFQSK